MGDILSESPEWERARSGLRLSPGSWATQGGSQGNGDFHVSCLCYPCLWLMQFSPLFHRLVAQTLKATAVRTLLRFSLQAGAYCKGHIAAGRSLQLIGQEKNRWWWVPANNSINLNKIWLNSIQITSLSPYGASRQKWLQMTVFADLSLSDTKHMRPTRGRQIRGASYLPAFSSCEAQRNNKTSRRGIQLHGASCSASNRHGIICVQSFWEQRGRL